MEEAIKKNVLEDFVAQIGTSGFHPGSDMIFHWKVPRKVPQGSEYLKKYEHKFLGFASPLVASLVCLSLGMRETEEIAKLCMKSSHQMTIATMRGYWFEHLAYMKLLQGGTFKCQLLGKQVEFDLVLPRSTMYMFNSKKEAAEKVKAECTAYCKPHSSNFPVVDSLSSPVLYFQMASGNEHGIKRHFIKNFVESMSQDSSKASDAYTHLSAVSADQAWLGPRMLLFLFVTDPSSYDNGFKKSRSILMVPFLTIIKNPLCFRLSLGFLLILVLMLELKVLMMLQVWMMTLDSGIF